jgi:CRP-like cAMP-binding protein
MKECNNSCDLKSCFLCQHSLPDWLPAIATHKKNYEVKKGEQIFKEGDAVTGIFFIYEGILKVHNRWDKEKELIIRFAKQGDIIGHLGLGNDPLYPVSATALTPAVVCYLERSFFESTVTVNTHLAYKLMLFLADELQQSHRSMRNLAHMSVKARIAQSLISLKNQFGISHTGSINLELTRQDIASFAGTTYETLFKVVNELTKRNIILLTGKKVFIKEEEMLLELIKQDNL